VAMVFLNFSDTSKTVRVDVPPRYDRIYLK
jgi:hypothetical protein